MKSRKGKVKGKVKGKWTKWMVERKGWEAERKEKKKERKEKEVWQVERKIRKEGDGRKGRKEGEM